MLWIKAIHIIFIASWFAGLFYLPRIYVNLAEEQQPAAVERLLGMAKRLYRFMTLLAIPALISGLILWLYYGIGKGSGQGWLHAKMLTVILILGYHHGCGVLLKKFQRGANQRSGKFYRYFNEIPVLLLSIAVILVVVKPF